MNATNVEVEPVDNAGDNGTVEYQEAPSASAVPVPTFTAQPPHTVPAPGIGAHPAQQNLKTLPQGKLESRRNSQSSFSG